MKWPGYVYECLTTSVVWCFDFTGLCSSSKWNFKFIWVCPIYEWTHEHNCKVFFTKCLGCDNLELFLVSPKKHLQTPGLMHNRLVYLWPKSVSASSYSKIKVNYLLKVLEKKQLNVCVCTCIFLCKIVFFHLYSVWLKCSTLFIEAMQLMECHIWDEAITPLQIENCENLVNVGLILTCNVCTKDKAWLI